MNKFAYAKVQGKACAKAARLEAMNLPTHPEDMYVLGYGEALRDVAAMLKQHGIDPSQIEEGAFLV